MIINNTKKHKITLANIIVFGRKATFDFQPGQEMVNSITQMEYESLMKNVLFQRMIEQKVLKVVKEKKAKEIKVSEDDDKNKSDIKD